MRKKFKRARRIQVVPEHERWLHEPKARRDLRLALADNHRRLITDLRAGRASAAEHLNSAAEKGDPQVYVAALKHLVESIGLTRVAKVTRLRREYLQRALSPKGKLRLSTYLAIMKVAKLKVGIARI